MDSPISVLPEHIEATIRATVKLYADQHKAATRVQLAEHREQMTLELVILSEQKLAKIIQLLEESRRDNPLLDNRVDASADAMATPADPQLLGHTINRTQPDTAQISRRISPAIP